MGDSGTGSESAASSTYGITGTDRTLAAIVPALCVDNTVVRPSHWLTRCHTAAVVTVDTDVGGVCAFKRRG